MRHCPHGTDTRRAAERPRSPLLPPVRRRRARGRRGRHETVDARVGLSDAESRHRLHRGAHRAVLGGRDPRERARVPSGTLRHGAAKRRARHDRRCRAHRGCRCVCGAHPARPGTDTGDRRRGRRRCRTRLRCPGDPGPARGIRLRRSARRHLAVHRRRGARPRRRDPHPALGHRARRPRASRGPRTSRGCPRRPARASPARRRSDRARRSPRRPRAPSLAGTPTYTSRMPYSPVVQAHTGSTSFVSAGDRLDHRHHRRARARSTPTPSSAARRSPRPPSRVRWNRRSSVCSSTSSGNGLPLTVACRGRATIASPWEPSVIASTPVVDTPSSSAMKYRRRAESRTPAMPTTRSRREPGLLRGEERHLVQRVRHDDQDRVRASRRSPWRPRRT